MYRTLFLKELRDVLGIAIAGLVVYLLVVTSGWATGLAPWSNTPKRIPFVDTSFTGLFACVAAGLALALGLKQTVSESLGDTYLFLLHRPMSRSHLIGMKLFVGLLVFLVCSAVPVLFYAGWAATPGTHASPFEWSMTAWTWDVWALMVLIYLGAFLSGLRPARWKGTRLLPLVGTAVLAGCVFACVIWSWIAGMTLLTFLVVLLISNILFVARIRDY